MGSKWPPGWGSLWPHVILLIALWAPKMRHYPERIRKEVGPKQNTKATRVTCMGTHSAIATDPRQPAQKGPKKRKGQPARHLGNGHTLELPPKANHQEHQQQHKRKTQTKHRRNEPQREPKSKKVPWPWHNPKGKAADIPPSKVNQIKKPFLLNRCDTSIGARGNLNNH